MKKTISKDFIHIGTLRKAFGTEGYLRVQSDETFYPLFSKIKHLFILKEGHYLPYFIEDVEVNDDLLLKFDEFDKPEQMRHIINLDIYVNGDQIDKKKYQVALAKFEIEGYEVIENELSIGIVQSIQEFPAQSMAEVLTKTGKTFLLPLVEAFILDVDFDQKTIYVELPEGIVDVN